MTQYYKCTRSACIFLMFMFIVQIAVCRAEHDIYALTPKQESRILSGVILHHSLIPPLLRHYYAEDDIPHWRFMGSTVITNSYVRLTTHTSGSVGHIINTEPLDMDAFEIVVGFRVYAMRREPKRIADGFGLWITNEASAVDGPILGRKQGFVGVGILFDEFDNDNRRNNPTVGVVYNGNKEQAKRIYSAHEDFYKDYKASCKFDYTKLSLTDFATARVRYEKGHLQVFLAGSEEENEKLCIDLRGIKLQSPTEHYHMSFSGQSNLGNCNHDILFVHFSPIEGVHYDTDIYKAILDDDGEIFTYDTDLPTPKSNIEQKGKDPSTATPPPTTEQQQTSKLGDVNEKNSTEYYQKRLEELKRELERVKAQKPSS